MKHAREKASLLSQSLPPPFLESKAHQKIVKEENETKLNVIDKETKIIEEQIVSICFSFEITNFISALVS